MTDDLTARLERALHVQEQHERDLRPDPATLAGLHAQVARRHRARTARLTAVAAASVLVVGAAGWLALQQRTTPEPAVPPTPAPTASAGPTPAVDAAPPAPVVLPGLPPMLQASDAVLRQAGPGWFVASYASGLWEPLPGDGERRSLVLSAPTGELYHLTDTEDVVRVVRWHEPGAARAEVYSGEVRHGATVDLLTGRVSVDDRLPVGAGWLGVHDDDELWTAVVDDEETLLVLPPDGPARHSPVPDSSLRLSPDGARAAAGRLTGEPSVVDVTTGDVRTIPVPAGQVCTVTAWIDATGVLATCSDPVPDDRVPGPGASYLDGLHPVLARLDALGGAPTVLQDLTPDGLVPWSVAHLRDGVVVGTAAPMLSTLDGCVEGCDGRVSTWTGGEVAPLTTTPQVTDDVCEVLATDAGTLLRTGDQCYEASTGSQWWLVDAAGAARLVAPAVDSELELAPFAVVGRD